MRIIAIVLGVLGGIIGIVSAISAFVAVGADSVYSARLWAGWLALILAALAGVAAMFITRRPFAASLTMLIGGVLGFLSINLFYVNTFYGLAILPWLIGAALAVLSPRLHTEEKRPSGNVWIVSKDDTPLHAVLSGKGKPDTEGTAFAMGTFGGDVPAKLFFDDGIGD